MSRQHQPHKSHSTHTATAAPVTPVTTQPGAVAANEATSERIRTRAYEISQAREGSPGNANADWAQAELELSMSDTTAL
ncbi:MAG: DUF2934 domain-containing protein [Planctomycetota bacterium]